MSDQPNLRSAEAQVIHVDLGYIKAEQQRQSQMLQGIGTSLETLTRVEQAQGHILDKLREGARVMQSHEQRLGAVERDMPGLRELRRWVIGGVLGGLGMMGAALIKMVLVDPLAMQAAYLRASAPQQQAAPGPARQP